MEIEDIIENIQKGQTGRSIVISALLNDKQLADGVKRVVKKILGSTDDFDHVIKLSIVQLIKNVLKNKSYDIPSSLHNHMFEISRYLGLAIMRLNNKTFETVGEELALANEFAVVDLRIIPLLDGNPGDKRIHEVENKHDIEFLMNTFSNHKSEHEKAIELCIWDEIEAVYQTSVKPKRKWFFF